MQRNGQPVRLSVVICLSMSYLVSHSEESWASLNNLSHEIKKRGFDLIEVDALSHPGSWLSVTDCQPQPSQ